MLFEKADGPQCHLYKYRLPLFFLLLISTFSLTVIKLVADK